MYVRISSVQHQLQFTTNNIPGEQPGLFYFRRTTMDVIRKTDTIRDVKDILDYHGMSLGHGWELIIAMLLSDCEYAEVHGFGSNAYFNKIFKEDINETA